MAFCYECGENLRDGAKFCEKCGAMIKKPETNDSDVQSSSNNNNAGTVRKPVKKAKSKVLLYVVISVVIIVAVATPIILNAYYPWLKMNDEQRIAACKNELESSKSYVEKFAPKLSTKTASGYLEEISFHEGFQGSGALQSVQAYCGNKPPDNEWNSQSGIKISLEKGTYSIVGYAKDKNRTRIEITGNIPTDRKGD